ncbi:hypothetical protein GCM10020220_027380 [Nonomuraea rubra]
MAASIIESPRTRRPNTVPRPVRSRGRVSASSRCSSARIGVPAAMSPTTGTLTRSPAGSDAAARRNGRTSIGLVTAVLRRSSPRSSRLLRCFDTDEDDLSPTARPSSRVLGGYPYLATQSRIVARIRCWRCGRAEKSTYSNAS